MAALLLVPAVVGALESVCVCVVAAHANACNFSLCWPQKFDHVKLFQQQAAGCCPMRQKRAQISGESELHRALPPPHPPLLVAFTVLYFCAWTL